MAAKHNSPVRLNSPLYEDGPWLKNPVQADMFRIRQLGVPERSDSGAMQKPHASVRGGSRRVTPTEPSVGSAHQAHKSTQYDDSGKRNTRKGNR